jgi:hypothetical protein
MPGLVLERRLLVLHSSLPFAITPKTSMTWKLKCVSLLDASIDFGRAKIDIGNS